MKSIISQATGRLPRFSSCLSLYLFIVSLGCVQSFSSRRPMSRITTTLLQPPSITARYRSRHHQQSSRHQRWEGSQDMSSSQTLLVQNLITDTEEEWSNPPQSIASRVKDQVKSKLKVGRSKLLSRVRNNPFQQSQRALPLSSRKKKIPQNVGYWSSRSTKESRRRRYSSQAKLVAVEKAGEPVASTVSTRSTTKTMWINLAATMLVSLLVRPSKAIAMGGGLGPTGPMKPMAR